MSNLCCHFKGCLTPSGFSLVCEYHRKRLTPSQGKRIMALWHALGCEKARVGDYFKCGHCNRLFPPNEIFGDHIYERSTHPKLKYDIRNILASCFFCNQKGNPTRAKHIKELREATGIFPSTV